MDPLIERVARIEERQASNTERIAEIHTDVKKLLAFRAWIMGIAAIAGAIGSVLIKPLAVFFATR